jgi:hypothetical protein
VVDSVIQEWTRRAPFCIRCKEPDRIRVPTAVLQSPGALVYRQGVINRDFVFHLSSEVGFNLLHDKYMIFLSKCK